MGQRARLYPNKLVLTLLAAPYTKNYTPPTVVHRLGVTPHFPTLSSLVVDLLQCHSVSD